MWTRGWMKPLKCTLNKCSVYILSPAMNACDLPLSCGQRWGLVTKKECWPAPEAVPGE